MSAAGSTTDLPEGAQVVIIGGGVIGTSVAYHLAHLGWTDVVLLERDQLTSGTTWHAAGLIVSGGMTTETLAWMTKYSTDLYAALEDETGLSTGFKPVGYLQTASNPRAHAQAAPRGRLPPADGHRARGGLGARGGRPLAARRPDRRARRVLHRERGPGRPLQRGDVARRRCRERSASGSCRGHRSPPSRSATGG